MGNFTVFNGDVTSAKGFKASGVHSGVKKSRKDMTIIFSDVVGEGAAVFTTNKACAAPIIISKESINNGKLQAMVVNSGNANACTGEKGLKDALEMIEVTADCLNIQKENIIVASTGIIGVPMPMDKIKSGIELAAKSLSYEGGLDAAEAILTTDTGVKNIAVTFEIDGKLITMGGMAKGSGMIHPNMATMLSFVTTDIAIDGDFLKETLKVVTDKTYNMISVDGDTSTNDMVAILANGAAGNTKMNHAHPEKNKFLESFYFIHEYLAKSIIKDGEGATKMIEAEAINAKSETDAKKAVKSILNSSLVKTAFFGEDGNWGRILCSVGYSEADFDMNKIEIYLSNEAGKVKIVEGGQGTGFEESEIEKILKLDEIKITVDFNQGSSTAKGWGCDLSYEYVKINGAYRT